MSASQGFLSHGGFECFEIIWVHHNRKEHEYLNVMCTYPWILFPWWHRSCQSFHSCWKHRWLGLSFQRDLWQNQPEKIITILLASYFPWFQQSFFILISDENDQQNYFLIRKMVKLKIIIIFNSNQISFRLEKKWGWRIK